MKKLFLWCMMLCCFGFVNSSIAFASDAGSPAGEVDILTRVVCNIVNKVSGPVAQGIATLVIIITGYSFFVGKVSIGMLFIVAAGIMFVFGAQTITGWVLGDAAYKCQSGAVAVGGKTSTNISPSKTG